MPNLWDVAQLAPDANRGLAGETVPAIFWNGVKERQSLVWLRQKKLGLWRSWTWQQTGEAVREVACGLMSLGFEAGECVSILSNTVVEWVFVDIGTMSAGGISSGIYPTDSASQVQYLCADSRTVCLFVEDEEQLDKALAVRGQLPLLRHIIVFDTTGLHKFKDPMVMTFVDFCAMGQAYAARHHQAIQERLDNIDPASVAILVYTSGTTGKPKGAMHSHVGLVYQMRALQGLLATTTDDERMCFLPLCHIAERSGGEFAAILSGARLNFVEDPNTIAENVREVSPTFMIAVPRVWEKFYSAVTIAIKEASGIQQAAYTWGLGVGQQVAEHVIARREVPVLLKLKFRLARIVALDNVCKLLGLSRTRLALTGAAPISPDLIRWYLALGVPMLEVWGMTETAGLSTWVPPTGIKPGSIGIASPHNEVKIDPATGEILVRGANVFMGYLNQPDKTSESIDADGWLHTGDVGTVDAEGYFRITDRMKDIIITAGGKNVTPSELENELKFSPYITDAVIIGDKRPYLTALVMIEQENVEKFAQDNDVPFSNYASLTRSREVLDLIQAEVDKVNTKFARVEQIKTFRLLETQLTAEDEELTATMKLKRGLVQKKYAELIEGMYKGST
jgi:long-chain acyl-CoA synthetase